MCRYQLLLSAGISLVLRSGVTSPGQRDALTWTSQDVLREGGSGPLLRWSVCLLTPLRSFLPSLQLLAFHVCDLGETVESWTSISCPVTRR